MLYILVALILTILIVLFWQISTLIGVFFGAQYVYSHDRVISQALKFAAPSKNQHFIELGSGYGWGLLIANKFGVKAIGVEISPFHYLISKLLTTTKPNIQVEYGDLFKIDLRQADLIYCYLLPKALVKLSHKFKKELKRGAQVISYAFKIKGLRAVRTKQVGRSILYLYQF